MGSIREYRGMTIATPLLVLGEVICEMAIPFLTAQLIDQIKVNATVEELLQPASILVLLALCSLAFGTGARHHLQPRKLRLCKNLRRDMFYNIQRFSFANIDEFSSSSLVTRLTTDINNVQQAFMMIIRHRRAHAAVPRVRLHHGGRHGRHARAGLRGHHPSAGLRAPSTSSTS